MSVPVHDIRLYDVSEVVTEWFSSDETTEDEADTPNDPGEICGPLVWPNSLLLKLTAPLTPPVLTDEQG